MFRSAPRRAVRGVTLIELMITIIVAAVLLAIAVPSFRHAMGSTNLSGIANDLAADVAFARTESAMRHAHVAVASSAGGWAAGWKVQVPSASTAATPPPPEILRTHGAIPKTYAISASSSATSLSYRPDGTLEKPATGICLTLKAPADTKNNASYVKVQPSGSIQQSNGKTAPVGCP